MNNTTKYAIGAVLLCSCAAFLYYFAIPSSSSDVVVVYVSHDQDYSEPLLEDFQRTTGIKVKAVYDTEISKTLGLVNRLIAEKNRPQADVFWNNEAMRTILLKEKGVLEPYVSGNSLDKPDIYKDSEGYWTGFAARARVIIYNTDLITGSKMPTSIYNLTNPEWKGKIGIGNPVLGTTTAHFAAIFSVLGDKEAGAYLDGLKENDVKIVESNGMVRDQVVSGDLYLGITDTDDANDALVDGKHVAMVFPDQGVNGIGTLVIPNTVMLVKNSPHKENGKKLIDYLLSKGAEEKLAASKAIQMPLGRNVPTPKGIPSVADIKGMDATPYQIYEEMNVSQENIQNILLT